MFGSFRQAMTWLHTWFGLVLGFVLMVVFFFGTLSVFDREIDRWAMPETRFPAQPMPSFDAVLRPLFAKITPDEAELAAARERVGGPLEPALPAITWGAYTTHRDPVLAMYAEFAVANPNDPLDHVHGFMTIDPRDGRPLPANRLAIGSGFFYPMHYGLHLDWRGLGYFVVGLAALCMLAALVSGVVMHKKLLREFFTLRPDKNRQRRLLDLHNLTGVVALPFHFFFPLTGLIIFASTYFPVSQAMLRPLAAHHQELEARARGLPVGAAGVRAELASVDAMVSEAKRRWAASGTPGEVGYLALERVGDANGHVSIYRAGTDRVTLVGQAIHFAAPTGQVILEEPPPGIVLGIKDFLTGLHLQHFEHWLLRWLYVFGGLAGCVCIATGLIFFVGKRKQKHAAQGVAGARVVDALAVATITGVVIATLAMLVMNRVLPGDLPDRGEWEERCFWLGWLLALSHGALRTAPAKALRLAPAWREQCCAIAVLGTSAVLLNWVTTGDHLLGTVKRGYWPVAGFDLALLAVTAVAIAAAVHLRRRERRGTPLLEDDAELGSSAPEAAHG